MVVRFGNESTKIKCLMRLRYFCSISEYKSLFTVEIETDTLGLVEGKSIVSSVLFNFCQKSVHRIHVVCENP